VCNPIRVEAEIKEDVIGPIILQALRDAETNNVQGKAVTPFLLNRIFELTDGRSLEANIQLVLNNARFASEIAHEMN